MIGIAFFIDFSNGSLCLRKSLRHHMIRNGYRIHTPTIGGFDVFLNITNTVHFRQFCMYMKLHPFFFRFILTLWLIAQFNRLRFKHHFPHIFIINGIAIGDNIITFMKLRFIILNTLYITKTLHDHCIAFIINPIVLNQISLIAFLFGAHLTLFHIKNLTLNSHQFHFPLNLMNIDKLKLIKFLFLARSSRLILFCFHVFTILFFFLGNRNMDGGDFHFTLTCHFIHNPNIKFKTALAQKRCQVMFVLYCLII